MKVQQIREAMTEKGLSVVDVQRACGYSTSFTSKILNDLTMDEKSLPVAIHRVLAQRGIIKPLEPTSGQIKFLRVLGYGEPVATRDEASALIDAFTGKG